MTSPGAASLSVLDLVPVTSGSSAAEALRNSLDLAKRCEAFGYYRYWFAEHHLNPGVAGTSPALTIAMAAAATTSIRLGSGAVQMGHRTPLSVVEEFGLLDAAYPGRLDLGLGRSGGRPPSGAGAAADRRPGHFVDGVRIPARWPIERLRRSPRMSLQRTLLIPPGAEAPAYAEQIAEIVALLDGRWQSPDGLGVRVVPGEGAGVQVWILGSSAGPSSQVAGERGMRFAANYHVSPATVLEAVGAYREAFRPSEELERPYVMVSADVVVADDDARAAELASGYGLWVRSIRTGEGAIPFPTPEEAGAHEWTDEERQLVEDRVETQFVGSPTTVADKLERLQAVTGADELLVTTITHDHADRVRSFQLLAAEWHRRHGAGAGGQAARSGPRAVEPEFGSVAD